MESFTHASVNGFQGLQKRQQIINENVYAALSSTPAAPIDPQHWEFRLSSLFNGITAFFINTGGVQNEAMLNRILELVTTTFGSPQCKTKKSAYAALQCRRLPFRAVILDLLLSQGGLFYRGESQDTMKLLVGEQDPMVLEVIRRHWQQLIGHGLDVNGRDYWGRSSILYELRYTPNELQQALQWGADPFLRLQGLNMTAREVIERELLTGPNTALVASREHLLQSEQEWSELELRNLHL